MKNLADVPIDEQRKFLKSFEHIFCDMDGVIWLNYIPIPGAKECLINLNKIGKKLSFVTNNTLLTPETISTILKDAGFEADTYTEVITPMYAVIDYLKSINFNKLIYVIGTNEFKEVLRQNGFSLVPDPPDRVVENLTEVLAQIQDDPRVGAVILDFDYNLTRLKLQKMLTYLKRKDCLFIAGVCDKDVPLGAIVPLIGNEHFAKCIAELSGRDYLQISKPSPNFLKFLIDRLGIKDPKKVLVIGDSIRSDMGLAAEAGYQKLLVFTGSSKPEDLLNWKYSENYKPDYYIDDLEGLKSVIENVYKM